MPSHVRPPPYAMCSREECDDRERFGEVSVFECQPDDSRSRPPNQRRIDPCLAVSKYRRSAAGSSAEGRYPVRTVEQLTVTVNHILEVLAEQRVPAACGHVHDRQHFSCRRRETMLSTVSFVEDRLRAVQVDLVKLGHPKSSRGLQLRMARCHVLILYLMADSPSYEATFGCASLRTAVSSYLAASPSPSFDEDPDAESLDEILSFALLFALRQDLLETALHSGSLLNASLASTSAALAGHRTHLQARLRSTSDLSLRGSSTLQWTMALLSHVVVGLWHMALRHLGPRPTASAAAQSYCSDREDHELDMFVLRTRCLLAPCLQHMRLEALKSYNTSFGKGEAVPASDVARLLQIPPFTTDQALSSDSAKSTWDSSTESIAASDQCETHGAAQAAVHFGRDVGLTVDPNGMMLFKVTSSPSLRVVANRKVRNDEDCHVLQGRRDWWPDAQMDARTDQDGVRIPPPDWMRRLTG